MFLPKWKKKKKNPLGSKFKYFENLAKLYYLINQVKDMNTLSAIQQKPNSLYSVLKERY